jgi:hypothetical protein
MGRRSLRGEAAAWGEEETAWGGNGVGRSRCMQVGCIMGGFVGHGARWGVRPTTYGLAKPAGKMNSFCGLTSSR